MSSWGSGPTKWACPASQDLWLHIIQCTWDYNQWLDSFWMTQAMF